MAQETGYYTWTQYGGALSGYNDDTVRIWLGSRDPRNQNTPSHAKAVMIADGWGGGSHNAYEQSGMVRVRVWGSAKSEMDDAATVTVTIADVNEPPYVEDVAVTAMENAVVGDEIGAGVFAISDQDVGPGGELSFTIVSGDPQGVFEVSADGKLLVARSGVMDPDEYPQYVLMVQATDGVHTDTGVVIVTVQDVNNKPQLTGATYEVEEESPVNTAVGGEPVATDSDESDSLIFTLTAGNEQDAFKVAACGGQIRVNKNVLDYEGDFQTYTLNVTVRSVRCLGLACDLSDAHPPAPRSPTTAALR